MKRFLSAAVALFLATQSWAGGDPMVKLSRQLAKGASSLDKRTVAILAFPYHDGRISSGSSILSERLTTDMVGVKNIQVVERRLIKKLLQEKNLSVTGLVEQVNTKTLGSILGVEAIITGTLIDLENGKTEINARMINAGTGEILSAAKMSVERNWSDRPVMPEKPVMKQPAPVASKVSEPLANPETTSVIKARGPAKLKLSNENFAPGRRRYHGPDSAAAKTDRQRKFYGYDEEYDDAYEPEFAEKPTAKKKPEAEVKPTSPPPSPYDQPVSLTERRIEQFKTEKYHRNSGGNDTSSSNTR